ncbi:MAG: response regulator [Dehalococcoidia bacterium]
MKPARINSPTDILLVEDNPGDARLAQEAFKEGAQPTDVNIVTDGIEAINFLRQQDNYGNAARPDLIILDLNLPRKDGRQVLAEIKSDPNLLSIPVIVLTMSSAEEDIDRCYALHANSYLVKPFEFEEFVRLVREIETFWLAAAKLPPKPVV